MAKSIGRPLPAAFKRSALVMAVTAAIPLLASAQTTQLPATQVDSQAAESYNVNPSSPKLTQPLINTPRTISVVSEVAMRDQGVTSLGDALRNVAGVSTFGGGEGGGGVVTISDKVTIRGFDARSSIYVDGTRDIAGYSRDMFNYEQLEVIKGAGGSLMGKSAAGGSVNLSSKHARLDNFGSVGVSYDELDTKRLTGDYNAQLTENIAIRGNALYSDGGDRFDNGVENYETRGLAGSVLFNLSESTSITLDALFMDQDNTPMLGMPFVSDAAAGPFVPGVGSPANPNDPDAFGTGGSGLDFGALPSGMWDNYYGVRGRDFEEVDTSMLTMIVNHRVSDNFSVRNQTRWGSNDSASVITRPGLVDTAAGDPVNYGTQRVSVSSLQMNEQENELFVTAFDGLLNLDFGGLQHDLVFGVEYSRETQKRPQLINNLSYVDANGNPITSPTVSLYNPSADFIGVVGSIDAAPDLPNVKGRNLALYLFDTINLGDHWQLDLNGRYDHYKMEGAQFISGGRGTPSIFTPGLALENEFFSWGTALSYKFNENSNVYVSYSDSNEPPGTSLAFSGNESDELDPETADSYEVGAKWQSADQRLLLSGAYFVTTRDVRDTDVDGNPFIGGEQESKGFELSAVGAVTDNFFVTASYTKLEAEVTQNSNVDTEGNGLAAAPDDTVALWGTYLAMNGRLTLGAGLNHSSGDTYWRQNRAYFETGSYTEVQAMAAYQLTDNARVQLNINNLTDEEYVSDYSARNHFLPNTPRNMKLSFNYNF